MFAWAEEEVDFFTRQERGKKIKVKFEFDRLNTDLQKIDGANWIINSVESWSEKRQKICRSKEKTEDSSCSRSVIVSVGCRRLPN